MTKDEVLKLALEALEDANGMAYAEFSVENLYGEAITAIREALAQPEQEPVACPYCRNSATLGAVYYDQNCAECVKRMVTPPHRKPLTDEEIEKIWWETKPYFDKHDFTRAIEAAHGIKE